MIIAVIYQASLSDPPSTSAVTAATDWISDVLFGPLATAIAVIAIAWFGFAMLSGRIDIRRGLAVVFGCFLFFGAKGIAGGLQSATNIEALPVAATLPPPPVFQSSAPNFQNAEPGANGGNVFDPYAGASVIQK